MQAQGLTGDNCGMVYPCRRYSRSIQLSSTCPVPTHSTIEMSFPASSYQFRIPRRYAQSYAIYCLHAAAMVLFVKHTWQDMEKQAPKSAPKLSVVCTEQENLHQSCWMTRLCPCPPSRLRNKLLLPMSRNGWRRCQVCTLIIVSVKLHWKC